MRKVRILLADDHAVVRAGIRNALTEIPGIEIVGEVEDGLRLFTMLNQTQPDCLLIDVAMPDFDPITAIRQIRKQYPEMKILVVSAYSDDVYVQGLLSAGVDGYYLKYQSLSDLKLAIERVLSGEKWLSGPLVDKLISYQREGSSISSLTTRQQDLLRLLQQGLDNQTIARRLGLSVKTVENNLTQLYRQLDVKSRVEAVNYVIAHPDILSLPGQSEILAEPSVMTSGKERVKVLVVDDNARYRGQLREMIEKVCPLSSIYEAEDVYETVKLVQQVKPFLIFVDVILGDEDGIECVRQIKSLQLPFSPRIILISAYPDREFHRLGLNAGATAFIDKTDLHVGSLRQMIDDFVATFDL